MKLFNKPVRKKLSICLKISGSRSKKYSSASSSKKKSRSCDPRSESGCFWKCLLWNTIPTVWRALTSSVDFQHINRHPDIFIIIISSSLFRVLCGIRGSSWFDIAFHPETIQIILIFFWWRQLRLTGLPVKPGLTDKTNKISSNLTKRQEDWILSYSDADCDSQEQKTIKSQLIFCDVFRDTFWEGIIFFLMEILSLTNSISHRIKKTGNNMRLLFFTVWKIVEIGIFSSWADWNY